MKGEWYEARRHPDCYVCEDEGWCLWDDDQGRWRAASFGYNNRRVEPTECQECNRSGEFTLDEWKDCYLPDPEQPPRSAS